MPYQPLVFLLTALFYMPASALEPPALPFLNKTSSITIVPDAHKPLLELLEAELTRQRQSNRRLQQYSKPGKIIRYETRLLNERLRAEGYYAAEIKPRTQGEHIVYQVNPGPLYRIEQLLVQLPATVNLPAAQSTGITEGDALRAQAILNARKKLTQLLHQYTCLYQIEVTYQVTVFHQTHTASVTLHVADSPSVTFADITFTGLQSIDASYLHNRIAIRPGQCFKRHQIEAAHLALMQTNLIASADIHIGEPDNGGVPITVNITERFHRTMSAGTGFQSDAGFGLSAGWEHRNILGRAQKLSTDAYVAQNQQSLSSSLTLPHFRRNQQTITFFADLEHRDTDAFESTLMSLGAEMLRPLARHLRGTLGAELELSEVEEDRQADHFTLLAMPVRLEYDKRNDPLDPQRGWVVSYQIKPYWITDADDTDTHFIQSTLAASAYVTLDKALWRPTIALRGVLGSINVSEPERVPANLRFYAGGGGSVRGYSFQSLSALTNGDPDGGLSLTQISLETRLRWGDHWGGVLFVDAGYAHQQTTPRFDQHLHWGAGFGVRYYTGFAPLRLDIAFPLDKRAGIDDDVQLYISIGQAF